jgi:outer membrane protein OmpA-like peptidoglycan-associated protein
MMFPSGSSTLTASAQNKIGNLITILQKYQTTLIQVIGHTDNRGSHSFNQNLSESRAATVASIIRNSNINNAIYKRGCSFDKPIAPNTTRSNLALNRRVEIFLYPNQEAVIDQCR